MRSIKIRTFFVALFFSIITNGLIYFSILILSSAEYAWAQNPSTIEAPKNLRIVNLEETLLQTAESSPPNFSDRPSNRIEYNIDRWGSDYRSLELSKASPSACLKACSQEAQCRAWTYVKPVNQNSKAMCWLKNDIPDAVSNSRCVSGMMRENSVKWLSQFVQYDQQNFSIAHNNIDDELVIVWEDHHSAYGEDWDIFGQRLDKRGNSFKGNWGIYNQEFAIASKEPNKRTTPDIVFNPLEREYLVAWSEEYLQYSAPDMDHVVEKSIDNYAAGIPSGLIRAENTYLANNAEDMNIWVRRIDTEGRLNGPKVQITDTPTFETKPNIAFNTEKNEYLIIWEDYGVNKNSSQPRAYGHLLAADGSLIGDKIEICASGCKDVAVEYGAGWYLVVWSEKSGTDLDPNIRGCWLDSTGSLSGYIDIETWENPQLRPRIAFNNGLNEFFVVWEDHHWVEGEDRSVFGRRIKAGGTFTSDRMGIAYKDGKYYMPEVTYNQNFDSYIVVYFKNDDNKLFYLKNNDDRPSKDKYWSSNSFDIKYRQISGDGGYYGPQKGDLVAWDTADGRNAVAVATNNENTIGDKGYAITAYGSRQPCNSCYGGDNGYNLKKVVNAVLFGTEYDYETDRSGSNYRSFDLETPEPELCEQACEKELQCKAWTYVKPGIQGPKPMCWLKHSVPEAAANRFCVSGVDQKQPTQPLPPHPPPTDSDTESPVSPDRGRLKGFIQERMYEGVRYYLGKIYPVPGGVLQEIKNPENSSLLKWKLVLPKPGNSTNDCPYPDKVISLSPGNSTDMYKGIPLSNGYPIGFCLTPDDDLTSHSGLPNWFELEFTFTK